MLRTLPAPPRELILGSDGQPLPPEAQLLFAQHGYGGMISGRDLRRWNHIAQARRWQTNLRVLRPRRSIRVRAPRRPRRRVGSSLSATDPPDDPDDDPPAVGPARLGAGL